MKKSSLFISAAITTFILAVIAGVIKAKADGLWSLESSATQTTGITEIVPKDTPVVPTDTSASSAISPQEATFIAGSVLGSTDFYSIDTVSLYGMDVYKVTFSSGNIVYVSPEGHVLLVTYLRRYVTPPSTSQQSMGHSSGEQGQQPSQAYSPTTSSYHEDGGSDDSGGDH
jgi:hypothetical protein